MAEKTVRILQQQTRPITVIKWRVQPGTTVSIGRPLLLYKFADGQQKPEQRKLKSTHAGTVRRIHAKEGDRIDPGELLLELEACCHPTIMNDMCAECGADLRKDDTISTASVPMVHAIPDLKVSEELAQKLGRADNERLIRDRKLVLLVDLDQTLIHTTNDNIPPNIRSVYHFQLYGPNSPWYHTRLRPGTHKFLNNIYDYYELHICTFGARNYAHMIALFLDANQKIFSNRILSRDECFDPTSKKANLKALFPCGDNMVCIIDDREDVWSHASNLIHVKPYHFFQHTGDINAPPGLDKYDLEGAGVDLSEATNAHAKQNMKAGGVNELKYDDGKKRKNDGKGEKGTGDALKNNVDVIDRDEKETGQVDGKEVANEKVEQLDRKEESTIKQTSIKKEANKTDVNGDDKNGMELEDNKSVISQDEVSKPSLELPNNSDDLEEPKPKTKEDPVETNDKQENPENQTAPSDQNPEMHMIEIEDADDYLIYLEDILKRIHREFYNQFDKMESGDIPDLKQVIPRVRSSVLKDCNLVFSGLVPTHIKLEQSKAYQVARSLGARVTQDIEGDTTHLVAVRPGTAKVNAGRRRKNLKIVTPDWLWCCAERWEHADERIFPLKAKGSKNRHPPPHCSSPERTPTYPTHNTPMLRKRTPSGRFMDTINPLMSFSSADIADMDKEVEDILDNDTDSSEEEPPAPKAEDVELPKIPELPLDSSDSSGSERTPLQGNETPPRGIKRKWDEGIDDHYLAGESSEDEMPSVRFRRGENIDDMIDLDEQESEGSIDPPDEVDDGEWNMMGAALEREFLANN